MESTTVVTPATTTDVESPHPLEHTEVATTLREAGHPTSISSALDDFAHYLVARLIYTECENKPVFSISRACDAVKKVLRLPSSPNLSTQGLEWDKLSKTAHSRAFKRAANNDVRVHQLYEQRMMEAIQTFRISYAEVEILGDAREAIVQHHAIKCKLEEDIERKGPAAAKRTKTTNE